MPGLDWIIVDWDVKHQHKETDQEDVQIQIGLKFKQVHVFVRE